MMSNWLLELFVGDTPMRKLILDLPEMMIGRSPTCLIHIPHAAVSRKHARLALTGRTLILQDLNSTNGLYVNGERATRALLVPGDRFTIGPYTFLISNPLAAPDDASPLSELRQGEDRTGRNTLFIDEEMRQQFIKKGNPFDETQISDDEV